VDVTDGTGDISALYYNEDGLVVKSVDALGNPTYFTYDGNFNLSTVTNAAGQSEFYSYNAAGEVTSSTDFLGNKTYFTYGGSFNNLTSLTDSNGNITSYSYNTSGDLLSSGAQNRPLMGAPKPAILRKRRFVPYRWLLALAGSGRWNGESTQDGRSSSNSGTCAKWMVAPPHRQATGRSPRDGWTPSSPLCARGFKTGQRAHRVGRLCIRVSGRARRVGSRAHRLYQRRDKPCLGRRSMA
jgi:YD repeat-containing protein